MLEFASRSLAPGISQCRGPRVGGCPGRKPQRRCRKHLECVLQLSTQQVMASQPRADSAAVPGAASCIPPAARFTARARDGQGRWSRLLCSGCWPRTPVLHHPPRCSARPRKSSSSFSNIGFLGRCSPVRTDCCPAAWRNQPAICCPISQVGKSRHRKGQSPEKAKAEKTDHPPLPVPAQATVPPIARSRPCSSHPA